MAKIGGKLEFDHNSNDWSIFKSRFVQYCTANDIDDATDKAGIKRRAVLLTALSEDTYRVAKDLVYPKELDNVEYKTIIEILSKQFSPRKSTFAERFNFYKAEQRAGEELTDWAARVRNLARDCGFDTELGQAMRDRFVLGLENKKEREKLFAEDIQTLTFDKAIEMARNVRCARLAIKASQPIKAETTEATAAGTPEAAAPVFAMQTGRAVKQTSGYTPRALCEVCGYKNHTKDKCRFANYTCKKCNKKGHLKKVCKEKVVTNNFLGMEDDENDSGIYNLFNIDQTSIAEPILQSIILGSQEIV